MPPAVAIGMVCSECGALVPESERQIHDNWHEWLHKVLGSRDPLMNGESNEDMLRRLLREVMELSQRVQG
jgi:hypothetical protein